MTTTEPTPEPVPTNAGPVLPPGFVDAPPPGATTPGSQVPTIHPPVGLQETPLPVIKDIQGGLGAPSTPAAFKGGKASESYPITGDPSIDEAIRQTVSNLADMRDAHGTGQTPIDGTYFRDKASLASEIKSDIENIGKAASHWTGESGRHFHELNHRLAN